MNEEPRHRLFGRTMSEWISLTPGELERDAIGLWQIVPNGRSGFGLEGAALADFIRRSVAALVERGAKPVIGGRGTPYQWVVQPQYGSTPAEIVENVVAEWLAAGAPDPDFDGLWFALPHVYEQKAAVRF